MGGDARLRPKPARQETKYRFGRETQVTVAVTVPREKPAVLPPFCPDDPTEAMVARRDPVANFLGAVRAKSHQTELFSS